MQVIGCPKTIDGDLKNDMIEKFFRTIGLFRTGVKSVMILGGGRMAYYLAKALILSHVRVKIIELDYKRCEYLCEALPEAVVIHGDGTDKETLQEEGLEKTDALVCLTGMDGGRGQVNIALEVLKELDLHIPVCGKEQGNRTIPGWLSFFYRFG